MSGDKFDMPHLPPLFSREAEKIFRFAATFCRVAASNECKSKLLRTKKHSVMRKSISLLLAMLVASSVCTKAANTKIVASGKIVSK